MTIRDNKGRFVKGHEQTSPGRPSRPVEIEFLAILKQGVTVSDWQKIVATAVSLAMAGEYKAREWISSYLIGKPPQILEITAGDAVVLKEVLAALEKRNIAASSVFNAMLSQLALAEEIEATDEQ